MRPVDAAAVRIIEHELAPILAELSEQASISQFAEVDKPVGESRTLYTRLAKFVPRRAHPSRLKFCRNKVTRA